MSSLINFETFFGSFIRHRCWDFNQKLLTVRSFSLNSLAHISWWLKPQDFELTWNFFSSAITRRASTTVQYCRRRIFGSSNSNSMALTKNSLLQYYSIHWVLGQASLRKFSSELGSIALYCQAQSYFIIGRLSKLPCYKLQ